MRPKTPPQTPRFCNVVLPILDTTAGLGSIGAGIYSVANTGGGYPPNVLGPLVLVPAIAVGALYISAAIHGFELAGECRERNRELAHERAERQANARDREDERKHQREQAWQLTQNARAHALAGECTSVVELDRQVRALDAELHASVFARDVGLQRCLAAMKPTPHKL